MQTPPSDGTPLELDGVPEEATGVIDELVAAGHEAYLVGGCVRDLIQERRATDFDVVTSAPASESLALFRRAIPIGLRYGTVMVPTGSGPVDVTCFRGETLADDLAHRDFTINALAYDTRKRRLIDLHEGRADLSSGRLRAVGRAAERFAEDPLRAVRAARLVATRDLEVDGEIESAMAGTVKPLRAVAKERLRHELSRMLLAPGAGAALTLLRRTGIEAGLAPGVREDASCVVDRLPLDLTLRLAGWLRGTRSTRTLRRLRFPRRTSEHVERLLRCHPVDLDVDTSREAAVRRQLKRVGPDEIDGLVGLRRAEIDCGALPDDIDPAEAAARLERFAEAVSRLREAGSLALERQNLALDGAAVMEILCVPPGPQVGQALSRLTDRIVEDPFLNTPEGLRALLESWAAEDGDSTT